MLTKPKLNARHGRFLSKKRPAMLGETKQPHSFLLAFAVTSSREDSIYSRQDLSQALCQLSQPRFSDLISNDFLPINWSNPFLNYFILLPIQKVAPNSLSQGVDCEFMANSFEQRLFSASDFHASLL